MRKNSFLLCCILVLLTGCKTISVQNKQYQSTKQSVDLGSIGTDENFVLEQTYNHSGIPNYISPIKVKITPISFNKSLYKIFSVANEMQPKEVKINYIDSLQNKPKFLNIEIADKVGLINILNDVSNKDVKNYLLNQNQSHVVTNISIAFNQNDLEALANATEVYLENEGVKSLALKIYNNTKVLRTINFNEGVVFGYRTSSCCWKENSKYQLEIIDLVEGDNSCPNQSYKSAKRAKKEVNYYKF